MAEIFTWLPDYGAAAERTPALRAVKYGNGYEQRAPDGLNNNPEVWNVGFMGRHYADEMELIDQFLKARGGVDYFLWTPPRSATQIKVICRSWGRVVRGGIYDDLTAKFEQVFDL